MSKKPTYEELEKRISELEQEGPRRQQAQQARKCVIRKCVIV